MKIKEKFPTVNVFLYKVRSVIPSKKIQNIVQNVLVENGYAGSEYSCAVHVVGAKRMRDLNKESRGIDKSTDVLSFPLVPKKDEFGEMCVGDIFICPQVIKDQAKTFSVDAEEEYVRMIVHGVLHIVGFDHDTPAKAKKMFANQEKWVSLFV